MFHLCFLLAGEELSQLKTAVTGMKEALADLKANTDPARAAVIKLNVRDARDSLRRRLSQISPETLAIQVHPCYYHEIAGHENAGAL